MVNSGTADANEGQARGVGAVRPQQATRVLTSERGGDAFTRTFHGADAADLVQPAARRPPVSPREADDILFLRLLLEPAA
jgi:hypothetical protein